MGDISAEPTMEDILSSIKRIIAEEGEAATAARVARKGPRAGAPRPDLNGFGHEEILELSDPMRAEAAAPVVSPPVAPAIRAASPVADAEPLPIAAPSVTHAPEAAAPIQPAMPAAPAPETILSPQAAAATRGPLEALSRMVVKPETPSAGDNTLEGLVRELLKPMLREWLDANLPVMVEQMVAREIARITGQHR